ncbi:Gfo/Idh/MocA family oxidoreductase [Rhodobacterales bacterium HKCCE3408]|nr:Gfo/Idh/MocA family oxidoreductase [Rhodobacterales bacterium HKCCE3408]
MRYGILGCGMMGQEHLRNIRLMADTSVAAICEPDPAMAAAAAAAAPEAAMVDSLQDLLSVEGLDALVIASPNDLHLPQLEEVARTRPLPVLLEKPAFTAPEDLARAEALAESFPELLWVAMEYRYMPPVARLLDLVDEVTGGIAMLSIREHRFPFLHKVGGWNRFNARSGGTMVEKCCHFFDLMRVALKAEPVRVMASGGQAVNHRDELYDGRAPDIWDHGYALVEFDTGARAMLELCMFAEGARWQEEIAAMGGRGKIEALVPGPGRFWPERLGAPPVPQVIVSPRDPKGPEVVDVPVDPELLEAGDHNGSTFYQHVRFRRAIEQGLPPEVSLRDGIAAVRMGMAAQQSALEGRVVELT